MCQIKESCIASLPEHQLLLQLRETWWQQSQLWIRQNNSLSRRGFTQSKVSLIQSKIWIWKHSSLVPRELTPRQQKTKLSHVNSTAVWPYNFWSSRKRMARWTLRNWWIILGAQYHTALAHLMATWQRKSQTKGMNHLLKSVNGAPVPSDAKTLFLIQDGNATFRVMTDIPSNFQLISYHLA